MSVASEILRLEGAKADIKTAIEAKGVTVPSSAKLDDYNTYVAQIPTGSSVNLTTLQVTPTTSAQTITPTSPVDGWDEVDVSAIQTQTKSTNPTTSAQTITPDSGKYLTSVSISAIQTETKSATPTTSSQNITPSSGKYLTGVSISAVTASIDSNITAGNIKSGTTILGVTGTYSGSGGGATLTPTAGDYPVVGNGGLGSGGSALTSTGVSVTIPVTGTYRLKWCAFRRNNSTSYTWSSRLYRTRSGQTTAIGTENSTWTSTYIQENSQDIACNAGDVITVYVRGRSNSYSWGGMLTACVSQKLWSN